jgi:3-isopropylmalate/(R)-2-methylmalate dehydratase large subunit
MSRLGSSAAPQTLVEKIWNRHVVAEDGGELLLHVDRAFIHEGASHAFDKLQEEGRAIARPQQVFAFTDHYVPTTGRDKGVEGIANPEIRNMVLQLQANAVRHGITLFGIDDPRQGILHIVPPEQGITQPGLLICGADSHTATHGAFGCIAFGIGASEMMHVMATQAIWQRRQKSMRIVIDGKLGFAISPKDIILAIIAKIGVDGGTGHIVEYAGSTIRDMSMEGRMTICNMSIEAGARAGMVAPDETTFAYLKGRPHAPQGQDWDDAVAYWRTLPTDADAVFDAEVHLDANELEPFVTWGTNPGQGSSLSASVPDPADITDANQRANAERALEYMDLTPGTPLKDVRVDAVFMGSCTNSRIEDLRAFASIIEGKKKADGVRVMVVPGSARVRLEAEAEGIDKIVEAFGAEWRFAGCSMCLGMNPDQLAPGERCASTSNRNFEGRQGKGGRTHLVSPLVAAATAIRGTLSSPSDLEGVN